MLRYLCKHHLWGATLDSHFFEGISNRVSVELATKLWMIVVFIP